jgi:hypothetical protein
MLRRKAIGVWKGTGAGRSEASARAHLEISRAYGMQGDNTAKAKTAYQNFLPLWKDADSDTPVLIADNPKPGG